MASRLSSASLAVALIMFLLCTISDTLCAAFWPAPWYGCGAHLAGGEVGYPARGGALPWPRVAQWLGGVWRRMGAPGGRAVRPGGGASCPSALFGARGGVGGPLGAADAALALLRGGAAGGGRGGGVWCASGVSVAPGVRLALTLLSCFYILYLCCLNLFTVR